MKSSVNIIATDPNGKKIQKAITDINPNASTAQLRDFVQNLNGLTNNTLGTPVRIDRTELVDESGLLDLNAHFSSGQEDVEESIAQARFITGSSNGMEGNNIVMPVDYKGTPYVSSNTTNLPVNIIPVPEEDWMKPTEREDYFITACAVEAAQWDNYYLSTGTIEITCPSDGVYKSQTLTYTITE